MSRKQVVGLVDVRSMFVSCERAFDPHLAGRPVIVLSNNDGCAVALSQEAKDLGIEMGMPWFQIRQVPRWRAVIARSSNYELYGDMSSRFVATLRTLVADLEVYSVDECFLAMAAEHATDLARRIRTRLWQWTGLPVAIGIGPTKTLAKVAQRHAKKTPQLRGVCDLTTWSATDVADLLAATPVDDVWGVGPRLTAHLSRQGVRTAADLSQAHPAAIRRRFSVVLERTVRELGGTPCIQFGHEPQPRQQVMYGRMLGATVTHPDEMANVLTQYASRAATRLRAHRLQARLVTVSISSSRFRDRSWHHSLTAALSPATGERADLIAAAHQILPQMHPGAPYNRAGILLAGLSPLGSTPPLIPGGSDLRTGVALDEITTRFGRSSIGYGVAGLRPPRRWDMRRDQLSPAYTTRWDQLLEVST